MAAKSLKYAYTILYCHATEGKPTWEEEECRAFADVLFEKFSIKTNRKYKAFWEWDECLGKNLITKFDAVEKQSRITIVLFSKNFQKNSLCQHVSELFLTKRLGTENLFPVCALEGKVPDIFIGLTSLNFEPDWRDDSKRWRILLNAICSNLDEVRMNGNPGAQSDEVQMKGNPSVQVQSDDESDESEEESTEKFPTDEQCHDLANEIGYEKNQIGTRLGISHARLEQIENNHRDTHHQVYTMLITWRQKNAKLDDEKKVKKLQTACEKSGRTDLQDKVTTMYKSYLKVEEEKKKVAAKKKELKKSKRAEKIAEKERREIEEVKEKSKREFEVQQEFRETSLPGSNIFDEHHPVKASEDSVQSERHSDSSEAGFQSERHSDSSKAGLQVSSTGYQPSEAGLQVSSTGYQSSEASLQVSSSGYQPSEEEIRRDISIGDVTQFDTVDSGLEGQQTAPPGNHNVDVRRLGQRTAPPGNHNVDVRRLGQQTAPLPGNHNVDMIRQGQQTAPPPGNHNVDTRHLGQQTAPPPGNHNVAVISPIQQTASGRHQATSNDQSLSSQSSMSLNKPVQEDGGSVGDVDGVITSAGGRTIHNAPASVQSDSLVSMPSLGPAKAIEEQGSQMSVDSVSNPLGGMPRDGPLPPDSVSNPPSFNTDRPAIRNTALGSSNEINTQFSFSEPGEQLQPLRTGDTERPTPEGQETIEGLEVTKPGTSEGLKGPEHNEGTKPGTSEGLKGPEHNEGTKPGTSQESEKQESSLLRSFWDYFTGNL